MNVRKESLKQWKVCQRQSQFKEPGAKRDLSCGCTIVDKEDRVILGTEGTATTSSTTPDIETT